MYVLLKYFFQNLDDDATSYVDGGNNDNDHGRVMMMITIIGL